MPYLIFLVTLFLSLHASPNEPTLTKIITPSSEVAGFDVDIDGKYSAIGSSGKVYIYKHSSSLGWELSSTIQPPIESESFGIQVAIEGNILVVADSYFGENGQGKIYIYQLDNTNWQVKYELEGSVEDDAELGYRIVINNGVIAASTEFGGGIYILRENQNPEDNQIYSIQKYVLPEIFSNEERGQFGAHIALKDNFLAAGAKPYLISVNEGPETQSHLGSCFIIDIENTENLQKISTTDPMINGFCGSIALTENHLITSSLDWFGVNQQIKLLSYKKDISGNWIKSDELVLPCNNDCDIADIDVSNNIIAATRFGVSSNLEDETIIEESYVQLFSINSSGRIQHLPSLPHKIYSDDVDSYFGWSISNNGNHVILGAPASTNGIISDKPQGAFYYFKIPMVGFSVPAMGSIGLLALGLSMLGLGAVRIKRK